MELKNIQTQLAEHIANHNKSWGHLLAHLECGNEASSYWDVSLNPTTISVNSSDKTFSFKNADFRFDVNSGVSYGEEHSLYSKQVSGRGTFQFLNTKIIQLKH
ncbi:hypothetical protein [Winogradskyella vidalii]|uniref:hypothetical protein n=1 Tax=Winogradskyella vidalii TaxID=2615024 RepID=UPI0015CA3D8F|nr:hypothetical protein [Winogradskyella vidalii]